VALQDVVDDGAQPHDATAGGLALDLKGGDQVVEGGVRGGAGLGVGQGESFRRGHVGMRNLWGASMGWSWR
jgi:hypothetical protein